MVRHNFVFNSKPPILTPAVKIGIPEKHPMFKYAAMRYARAHSSEEINSVLNSCPLQEGYKNALVDIKIHELTTGECPCLFGWHLDGSPNPFDYEKPALYHLYLIGPKQSRTLFINEPVELEIDQENPALLDASYKKQLAAKSFKYGNLPENTWVTFTSEDFHSGPIFNTNARRLLIRVAQNDHVAPRNKIVEESFSQKIS